MRGDMRERAKILSPQGAIAPTGTWSLGARAGDFVFVAGMRGIDPATNTLVAGEEARIRQAFTNMKTIAESEGASLARLRAPDGLCHRHGRLRPLVNKVQEELWGGGPYPPRTIVEVARLNQDDIFEVEGTFYAPAKRLDRPGLPADLGWRRNLRYIYRQDEAAKPPCRTAAQEQDEIHGHRAIHRQRSEGQTTWCCS